MQGFDYQNQATVIKQHHTERLAEARRENLVRAARGQRAGVQFQTNRRPSLGERVHVLVSWFAVLAGGRPARAH
jgi:hypothetical protein